MAYSDNRHMSDYVIFSNPDGLKLTKNPVITSTLNNGNPILVIPQTLKSLYGDVNEDNYTLSVTFDKKITTDQGGEQNVETRTITCYRDLSALQWKSWDLNKSYIYSFEMVLLLYVIPLSDLNVFDNFVGLVGAPIAEARTSTNVSISSTF